MAFRSLTVLVFAAVLLTPQSSQAIEMKPMELVLDRSESTLVGYSEDPYSDTGETIVVFSAEVELPESGKSRLRYDGRARLGMVRWAIVPELYDQNPEIMRANMTKQLTHEFEYYRIKFMQPAEWNSQSQENTGSYIFSRNHPYLDDPEMRASSIIMGRDACHALLLAALIHNGNAPLDITVQE